MSTPALTVQPRHLALPDACLVTPSQLSIPRSISKEDFLAVAAKLKALGQAEDFWLADAASFSKKWDDGLQLMASTVGRTKYHLVRVAQIAERFTPAKRFSYTVAHLRALMPFPDEFLDRFLPSAANLNLSVKALRARAETEFGSNPYKPQQPKKRSVPLRASLVAQLSERAPRKVSALVERICDEWLSKSPELQASVLAGEELQKEQKKQKAKEPEAPEAPGTADVRYQLKLYEAAKAKSAVVGVARNDGNDVQSAQPHTETSAARRPSYEDRRKQNGSAGFKKKEKKPRELRLLWTTCGRQRLPRASGPTLTGRAASHKADCFATEQEAIEAEAQYAKDHGYRNEVVQCLGIHQGRYHVRHSYSGDHFAAQKKSAPISQGA